MAQTTVSAGGQAVAVAGQAADSGKKDIVSGFNKDTVQIPMGYGVRVQPGSNGDAFLLPTGFSTVGGDVAGINLFNFNHMRQGAADPLGNFAGDMGGSGLLPNAGMQVLREGRVYVPVQDTVRAGDRAYCLGIATGNLTAGLWAGSGYGASYHIDCTRQGVFRSGTYTAADGTTKVAVLEVDFTNKP
jgi:hypothetical protein